MKPKITDPEYLPVMESFHTIQGEGRFVGCSAYFIRLGGCDVGCHWCDVKESWDASAFDWFSVERLVKEAKDSGSPIAVVTGGEPLIYNLSLLTQKLQEEGLRTHIETSGTHSLSGHWDWICFSPKKFKAPLDEFYTVSHELKIVVFNKHDLKWGGVHGGKMNRKSKLYFQSEWSKTKEVTPLIVEFVKQHPTWQISIQAHKYMDVP